MVVGVCRLTLLFPAAQSLKDKRSSLRKITERVKSRFNAAVAEVADQDSWQRCTIGVSVVSNASDHAQSMLDKICDHIEQSYIGEICDRQAELLHYADDDGWPDDDRVEF
ncbi:MAG: DUF503 domain-containing protein [Deltaproteobacteria bacterium]|nr:DUF503 domain-containing protein [Deltaproteobacteria bacterium]